MQTEKTESPKTLVNSGFRGIILAQCYGRVAAPRYGIPVTTRGYILDININGTAPSSPQPGYVYLVWAVGTPRYKIGRSKDPARRIEALNTQSCYPLKLLDSCFFKDCVYHEIRLHALLDKYRVHGEWFEIPQELPRATQEWFNNPKCIDAVVGHKPNTVVICNKNDRLKRKEIDDLATVFASNKIQIKIPDTEVGLRRALTLLGCIAKGTKLSGKPTWELIKLIGLKPRSSIQAQEWKKVLKSHLENLLATSREEQP